MKVTKGNKDDIKNKVTTLAALTTNMGIQALRKKLLALSYFILKLLMIIKTSWPCHDSRGHRHSGMVTKEYSRISECAKVE